MDKVTTSVCNMSDVANRHCSLRNSSQDRCPSVKWSGIQTVCEESESDVLILLDCCASGVSNSDEGMKCILFGCFSLT